MLLRGPGVRCLEFGVTDRNRLECWSSLRRGRIKIVLAVVGGDLLSPLQAARSEERTAALLVDLTRRDRPASSTRVRAILPRPSAIGGPVCWTSAIFCAVTNRRPAY